MEGPSHSPSHPLLAKQYPSKVLLFGEYTVLMGSAALAVPYRGFSMGWSQQGQRPPGGDAFIEHLRHIAGTLHFPLDVRRMDAMRAEGWHLQSNIPVGQGLGSSAALCAAAYELLADPDLAQLAAVTGDLATMESHFHGRSSGIDALVSLSGQPVLFDQSQPQLLVGGAMQDARLFLIGTETQRSTAPLVKWFKAQLVDPEFARSMMRLKDLTQDCVDAYRSGQTLFEQVKSISRLQFESLQVLIPASMRTWWAETLTTDDLAMKLCGAGGGGYFLLYQRRTSEQPPELPFQMLEVSP